MTRNSQPTSSQPPFSPGFSTTVGGSCSPAVGVLSSSVPSVPEPSSSLPSRWDMTPSPLSFVSPAASRCTEGGAGKSSSTPNSVHSTSRSIQLPSPKPRSRVRRCISNSSISSSESGSESDDDDGCSSSLSEPWLRPYTAAISARTCSSTKSGTKSSSSLPVLRLREWYRFEDVPSMGVMERSTRLPLALPPREREACLERTTGVDWPDLDLRV